MHYSTNMNVGVRGRRSNFSLSYRSNINLNLTDDKEKYIEMYDKCCTIISSQSLNHSAGLFDIVLTVVCVIILGVCVLV